MLGNYIIIIVINTICVRTRFEFLGVFFWFFFKWYGKVIVLSLVVEGRSLNIFGRKLDYCCRFVVGVGGGVVIERRFFRIYILKGIPHFFLIIIIIVLGTVVCSVVERVSSHLLVVVFVSVMLIIGIGVLGWIWLGEEGSLVW